MFKLMVTYPDKAQLKDIVMMTQATMEETAEAACDAEQLLNMRATAKEILVSDKVLDYAMNLVVATQPESEAPAKVTKKYIRCGASPRAGQALITAAKVRALINGRYNVSVNDINALAGPVLRHRLKTNFEAITEHIDTDAIVAEIIKELGGSTKEQIVEDGNGNYKRKKQAPKSKKKKAKVVEVDDYDDEDVVEEDEDEDDDI